jgi:hypothetical protein
VLTVRVAEYERIGSSGVRFPIAIGHDFPEVENVVDENERYAVVQKRGVATEEAAKLDLRSGEVEDGDGVQPHS